MERNEEVKKFLEMLRKEIKGFEQDGEEREVYLHIRQEFPEETIKRRVEQDEIISGAGPSKEDYDFDDVQKTRFKWVRHFWLDKATLLEISKILRISQSQMQTSEFNPEGNEFERARIEWYETNIPYFVLEAFRSGNALNYEDFEYLSQAKILFSLENGKEVTDYLPEDIKIDKIDFQQIETQAQRLSQLDKQWKQEFSPDSERQVNIIKLWKLDKFAETLIEEPGQMLNYGGYTIFLSTENAYNIVHISGYGFHSGSILGWTPRSYQWILDELEQYVGGKYLVHGFIGRFYRTWGAIPDKWLPAIKEIIETPVTAKEIQRIDEIVKENNLKVANAWLWKAESYAKEGWHEDAFKNIEKAKSVSSKIDREKVEGIKSLAREKGIEKEIERSIYWHEKNKLYDAALHLDKANELAKETGRNLSDYSYIYKWVALRYLDLAYERSGRSKEKLWMREGIVEANLNSAKKFAKKAETILPDDKVKKIEKRLRGNIFAKAIKKFS